MNIEVELPDLGVQGGDEARVAEWHFEEGEHVDEGETLLEVVCELETIEVPCPCSGVLIERIVDEDGIVRVGEPVALVEADEEWESGEEEEDE